MATTTRLTRLAKQAESGILIRRNQKCAWWLMTCTIRGHEIGACVIRKSLWKGENVTGNMAINLLMESRRKIGLKELLARATAFKTIYAVPLFAVCPHWASSIKNRMSRSSEASHGQSFKEEAYQKSQPFTKGRTLLLCNLALCFCYQLKSALNFQRQKRVNASFRLSV